MMVTTVGWGRVCGKACQYPYFQACLYEFRPRKKDHVVTARFVCTIDKAFRSAKLAERVARDYAAKNGIEFRDSVRHGSVKED